MASIAYEDLLSTFFTKVEAYDFLNYTDEQISEYMCSWIHSTVAKPVIRKLFKTISLDDDTETMTYEMKVSIDESSDKDFIIDIISYGMVVAWITPKVNSLNNMAQMFGTKDAKFFSQSNHLSELRELLKDSQNTIKQMIAERGFVWNPYLNGSDS